MRNGTWRKIKHQTDGYEVALKKVELNGQTLTVCIDNFSVTPMSIQTYDCMTLNIDNE